MRAADQFLSLVLMTYANSRLEHLSICYLNVGEVRTKIHELSLALLNSVCDIVVLSETWLTKGIRDSEFCDGEYTIYRCDRNGAVSGTTGDGGEVMACAASLPPTVVRLVSVRAGAGSESFVVKLRLPGRTINITAVYLGPPAGLVDYQNFIFNSIGNEFSLLQGQ